MHPVPFSNFTLSFTIYPTNTTNTPIKVNGDICFHPVDKANSINNYYTSVSNIDYPLAPCELSGIVINEQEVYDQFQILNISIL
jgi:hypothetical protein